MKLTVCFLLLAGSLVALGAPTEKIETISWEEQHQKTIKSAPVDQPKVEEGHHEEHHSESHHEGHTGAGQGIHTGSSEVVIEVKPGAEIHHQEGVVGHHQPGAISTTSEHHVESEQHGNVETHVGSQPILEAAPFPTHNPNIPHVNETEARINIADLEQKFTTAQSEGGEGLDRFLAMIHTERDTLQKLYERMSLQAEANVRGSLQKSREWEENARRHAKESLERLLELQKRAEEKTRDLVNRQQSTVRCVNCEEAKLRQDGAVIETHRESSGRSFNEGVGPSAEIVSGSHHGSNVHHESSVNHHDSSNLGASSYGSHHQSFPVETTTTIEEWSTKLSEHSSTIVP